MAIKPFTEVKFEVAREMDFTRDQLIRKAASLSETLKRMATDLAQDTDASFNGLGVIQGQGAEIDRLCGELKVLRGVHSKLQWAQNREEEAAQALTAATDIDCGPVT